MLGVCPLVGVGLSHCPPSPLLQFNPPPLADAFVVGASSVTKTINFQYSPISKQSGIMLNEPERVYPVPFITYLTGVVQAWVTHFVTPLKCTYEMYK
jgi:hypothetical protein